MTIEVEMLSAGAETVIVARIAALINEVYAVAEEGIWLQDAVRTSTSEIADFIRAGEIAVSKLDGQIVGVIRIQRLPGGEGEFGMLAASPQHRGLGIGRELVRFAEKACADAGAAVMQLELLVPRAWKHPSKESLAAWYIRLGYRIVRTSSLDESYPQLAPKLATPCNFVIYQKPLTLLGG